MCSPEIDINIKKILKLADNIEQDYITGIKKSKKVGCLRCRNGLNEIVKLARQARKDILIFQKTIPTKKREKKKKEDMKVNDK